MKKIFSLLVAFVVLIAPNLAAANNIGEENKGKKVIETIVLDDTTFTLTIEEKGALKIFTTKDETTGEVTKLTLNTVTQELIMDGKPISFSSFTEETTEGPEEGELFTPYAAYDPDPGTSWTYLGQYFGQMEMLVTGSALVAGILTLYKTKSLVKTTAAVTLAAAFLSGISTSVTMLYWKTTFYRAWNSDLNTYVYQTNNWFYSNSARTKSLGGFSFNTYGY